MEGGVYGRKCHINPGFSGVPRQGDEIRSGCLNPASSGAHKRAEVLRNPCILGSPQTRGQNQKWMPHPGVIFFLDEKSFLTCAKI